LYTAHDRSQQAWFSRDTPGDSTASAFGFGGTHINSGSSAAWGAFTPHGVAATSPAGGYSGDYQLLTCDSAASQTRLWMEVGFMVSGFGSGGYKQCGNWQNDVRSPYYRVNGDYSANTFLGQSFNEDGHTDAGDELLSVGLR
jgi:hypothetical protein